MNPPRNRKGETGSPPPNANASEFYPNHRQVNERYRLWVLKNSFQGISTPKSARKLLNVRSSSALEFTESTALVPFSTPTPVCDNSGVVPFRREVQTRND